MSGPTAPTTGRFLLTDGVVRGFAAELLLLPTGLITAVVLTRVLGPEGYGLFSIAATFISWMAWTTTALLARAAVKFVSEAADWTATARSVLRWRLAIGSSAFLVVLAFAGVIARAMHTPELAPYLRVFALDLLLFNLARAYREVLTGRGRFREVAWVSVVRWMSRMVLIVTLVMISRSVMAAVIGSVGATLAELLWARRLEPLAIRGPSGVTAAQMWGVAAPLLIYGAAMQIYAKVDLFALTALGGTVRDAGFYAAAQNLAVGPGLFALALGPLLLATLARLRHRGDDAEARRIGRVALRVTMSLVPLAAIVAGSAAEIVLVVFGPSFAAAGPLLAILFAAAAALAVIAVAVAIITAANAQRAVSVLGVGIVVGAIAGHLLSIPRYGAIGAASVTLGVGAAGALVALAVAHRVWNVHVYATIARAAFIAVPVYATAMWIETDEVIGLTLKLALLSSATLAGFVALGELDADERARWRAARLRWRPTRGVQSP